MEAQELSEVLKDNHQGKIIEILEAFKQIDMLMENPVLKGEVDHLLNRIKDNFFRVAVVGEFSSGKSTFINALIEKDVLKHGAQETTATLTRIINIPAADKNQGRCKVNFSNGDEKILDNLEQVTSYTTTSSESFDVSQDISSFDIYMHFLDMENPIMIIDTPGLNGLADNHREQTIQQLKDAHACIYMLQLRGLTQSDIDFIRFISSYQHDFIFVQNFIDELQSLEDETLESKLLKQNMILKNSVFFDKPDIRYELCGISSRKALIARDYTFEHAHEYSDGPLNAINRKKLLQESNFGAVFENLKRLMASNYKGKVQQRSVIQSLLQLIEYLSSIALIKEKEISTLWEESDEAKIKNRSQAISDKLMENKESHLKKIGYFVDSKVEELNLFISEKVKNDLNKLEKELKTTINSHTTIETLEQFIERHQVEDTLGKAIPEVEHAYSNLLEKGFQDVMNSSILRIQSYIGECTKVREASAFNAENIDIEIPEFIQDETILERLEEEITDLMTKQTSISLEKERIREEEKSIQTEQLQNQIKSKEIQRKHQKKMDSLGIEPLSENIYVDETGYRSHKEDHAILGGLMDFFIGEKRVEYQVPALDTSKKDKWKAERNKLLNQFNEQKCDLDIKMNQLMFKINASRERIKHLDKSEEAKSIQLKNMEEQYGAMKDALDTKRTLATMEYMNLIKKTLLNRIHGYLYEDENVLECFLENVAHNIQHNRETLKNNVTIFYETAFQERIKRYKETINGQNKHDETEFINTKEKIEKIKLELEECLCQIL